MNSARRPALTVLDLDVRRNGVPVVRHTSFNIWPSEVVALVGANGSGKTTLLEAVSGVVKPFEGAIQLHGNDVTNKSRRHRNRCGLRHVRQGRRIFADLSVEENLRVASNDVALAYEVFPELRPKARMRSSDLSGGEQQMLVLARALITDPSVLLIDEISLGLAPRVIQRLIGVVKSAAEAGVAVLLVEQFATIALEVAETVLVLARGQVVLEERADVLLKDPSPLHRAYFGPTAVPSREESFRHD